MSQLLWFGFACVIAIASWAAPRGIDMGDSGCYFLDYCFPSDSIDTHTSYRYVGGPLFRLVGENIVAFRWLSWVFVWASALVFAWGFRRHLRLHAAEQEGQLSLGITAVMFLHASSAMYTIKPAALTYNSLNLVLMYVALGLFLAGMTSLAREAGKIRAGVSLVAGGVLAAAADFFIKPSTALLLLASFAVYALCTPIVAARVKKLLLVAALSVTALGLGALTVFLGGFAPVWVRVMMVWNIARNNAYMEEMLTRIAREFGELGAFLLHDLRFAGPLLLLAAGVVFRTRNNERLQRRLAALFGLLLFAAWIHLIVSSGLWRGSHEMYAEGTVARSYLSAVLISVGAVLVSWWIKPNRAENTRDAARGRWIWLITVGMLVMIPFAGAVGSTTSVYLNGALFTGCWLAVILLALHDLASRWKTAALWPAPLAGIATLSVVHLFHGQIAMPYMTPRPLWEHTQPVAFGISRSELLVDPATATLIENTRAILEAHGFKPGDDIFGLFNLPTLVYAVGGRSPTIPWYFGRVYDGDLREEIYMRAAGPERHAKAWIITLADAAKYSDHIKRGGLNFPDEYECIGTLPYVQHGFTISIWKRKNPAP